MLLTRVLFVSCFGMLLSLLAGKAYSQTTFASITGTVTDATGSAVPGATVTATNVQTNIKTSAKCNEAGSYTIAQLKEGTYKVRAEAAGFKAFVADNVGLVARDVRRVDVKLEVGDVTTQVEVSGGATLIETETARITDTKDSLVLNTIPTNSRGLWAYLNLAPGLQGQDGSSVTRFAGSRVNENNWSIDGTTFSDGVDNTQTGPLANYIESFQEVKIDLVEQLGGVRLHRAGHHYFQVGDQPTPRHGVRLLLYAVVPRQGFFLRHRAPPASALPGAPSAARSVIPKIYNGKNRTFFYYSYETSRGSAAQDESEPDRGPGALEDR